MTAIADFSEGKKHIANGVFVEEGAWHGEGKVLTLAEAEALGIIQLFKEAGMDWTVELRELLVPHSDSMIKAGIMGITRTDTGKVFGTSSDHYKTFQNGEVAEHVQSYMDTGLFKPSAFVSLKDGAWNSATLRVGNTTLKNGDQMKMNAVWTWGHDGKQGVRLMLTDTRVVCCNTFRLALKDAKSIRHKGSIREKMDKIREEHLKMMGYFDQNHDFFNKLLEMPFKSTWLEQYSNAKRFDTERIFEQMKLEKDEGTMFQAYQAVSRWSDHVAGGKKVQNRMMHVLTGMGAARMEKVTSEFQELLAKPFLRDEREPEYKEWLAGTIGTAEEIAV